MKPEITITKMKGESHKMHHRFEVYNGPGERNYQKTADILNKELSELSGNETPYRKVTPEALMKNAERWLWAERCGLDDAKKIISDAEELDEDFREYNKKVINILKELIDFLEKKLQSIYINEYNYAPTTQLNILNNAMNILDKAIYNYRLSCGRSTDNKELKHQGELELSGTISNENIFVYTDEEMQRIQNIQEVDEETQKFLDEL